MAAKVTEACARAVCPTISAVISEAKQEGDGENGVWLQASSGGGHSTARIATVLGKMDTTSSRIGEASFSAEVLRTCKVPKTWPVLMRFKEAFALRALVKTAELLKVCLLSLCSLG